MDADSLANQPLAPYRRARVESLIGNINQAHLPSSVRPDGDLPLTGHVKCQKVRGHYHLATEML